MEQALQKQFVFTSLQVKNLETEIKNLEREREKINKKNEEQICHKQQLEHDQRHVLQKIETTEEIHAINKNHHQEPLSHIVK